MISEKSADQPSKGGGRRISLTPSTASLTRKLGTSPAPRMLTRSEIDLLRSSKREMLRRLNEAHQNKDSASRS